MGSGAVGWGGVGRNPSLAWVGGGEDGRGGEENERGEARRDGSLFSWCLVPFTLLFAARFRAYTVVLHDSLYFSVLTARVFLLVLIEALSSC
jgi:hypothetical protein